MKEFIIDKALVLIIGIFVVCLIPTFCGPVFTLIFETLALLLWWILCKTVILLPLDLILGAKSDLLYFSRCRYSDKLEFFRNKYYSEWEFYTKDKKLVVLVNPFVVSQKELLSSNISKDRLLEVRYYRFSKIIHDYAEITHHNL